MRSVTRFDQAFGYAVLGWSVIPLRRDKRPCLAWWATYQHRRPTPAELQEWRRRFPEANVGIVTGAISGVVVLDVDGPEGQVSLRAHHLSPTPTVATGNGMHLYFRHPGRPVSNFARRLPGLDFRGDGGYVMAPPPIHPSGRRYAWVEGLSPWDVELAPLPDGLERLLAQGDHHPRYTPADEWALLALEGVAEGARNDTTTRLAGHLLRRGVEPVVVAALLLAWNDARDRPPLPTSEVLAVVQSVSGREAARRRGRTA